MVAHLFKTAVPLSEQMLCQAGIHQDSNGVDKLNCVEIDMV
jgi:hypothetical protein